MHLLRRVALTVLVASFATFPHAQAQAPDTLRDFLAAYRCPVVDRLDRIHAHGDAPQGLNRYITITVPEHVHGYVQCIFNDHRTRLLCEAASGFYLNKLKGKHTFRLEGAELVALTALGFSTDDSAGNFRREQEISP